jgi:hypothetical protein
LGCIGRAIRKISTSSRIWQLINQESSFGITGQRRCISSAEQPARGCVLLAKKGREKINSVTAARGCNRKQQRELESLLLEALPFDVRSWHKQGGKLPRYGTAETPLERRRARWKTD